MIGLFAVTVTPCLVITLFSNQIGGYPIIVLTSLINALSTAHVPMTMYLFTDNDIRSKCRKEWIQNLLIPLSLVTVSIFIFLGAPLYLVMIFILVFVHYQIWHFGSQNVGVYSFCTKASQNRPITLAERRTIKLSTLGGMMGMIPTFHPLNFNLDRSIFPFDYGEMLMLPIVLYYLGIILTICSISYALYLIIKTRLYVSPINCLIFLASALFFVPVFILNDFFTTFFIYGTAHGLQYILILGFHSVSNLQNSKVKPNHITLFLILSPIFIFIMACILLSIIWSNLYFFIPEVERFISSFTTYIISEERSVRIIMGVLYGVTLAHFWFDQNLWRLRQPQTANWIKFRYSFLFAPTPPLEAGE